MFNFFIVAEQPAPSKPLRCFSDDFASSLYSVCKYTYFQDNIEKL